MEGAAPLPRFSQGDWVRVRDADNKPWRRGVVAGERGDGPLVRMQPDGLPLSWRQ
eukprot:gene15867-61513_t